MQKMLHANAALRCALRCAAVATLAGSAAIAQSPPVPVQPPASRPVIPLWPGVAPGSENARQQETRMMVPGSADQYIVRNVVSPTLTVYLPAKGATTRTAVLVVPGGGFRVLAMKNEGHDVAEWFAQRGMAAFVLKYRLAETPADNSQVLRGATPAAAGAPAAAAAATAERPAMAQPLPPDTERNAVADGIQALKIIRSRAGEWGVAPNRVLMVGFSAGGVLTAGTMLTEIGAERPNYAALIYGAPFGPAPPAIPAGTPPAFLAVAEDDALAMNASLRFFNALRDAKSHPELHVYRTGQHGFAMMSRNGTSDRWIDELNWWMESHGLTRAPFDPSEMQAAMAAYNRAPDTAGSGRYPAIKEMVESLANHVVYRPKDLDALGTQKLGVLAWGNGGCAADGAGARFHLSEIASHGYLAIANGTIQSGPGAPPPPPRPAAAAAPAPAAPAAAAGAPARAIPPPATSAAGLREAIDWALAENSRRGSPYYGRIDPKRIAVSGWSCGGLQALEVAGDPRVAAVIIHNSGIFSAGASPITGMSITKEALRKLHTPVLYVLGGPTDIAYANGMDDFARIEQVPAMVADLDVGHGGTFLEPNGGKAAAVAVNWLDWQLKGDRQAARQFTGADCGLCANPEWQVQRRGEGF